MARGLDHIVHAVRDLDAAAEFYRRAGFTVGARNRHPWGTHNHVVQCPGFFIEVLTVAEPDKLVGEGLPRLFGAANREAIARGDGFSMLILESRDIASDVADFRRSGFAASDPLPFSRQAVLPDGSATTVGFSLAFARDPLSPRTGFAACQQHNPAAFWKPEFQRHANGATGVVGAVLVADNPTDHHIFLSAWTGERALHATSLGVGVKTPRGRIDIMEQVAFRDEFGTAPAIEGEGAVLAGLRLGVADVEAAERLFAQAGIAAHRHLGRVVVPPQAAFGATLIFERSGPA